MLDARIFARDGGHFDVLGVRLSLGWDQGILQNTFALGTDTSVRAPLCPCDKAKQAERGGILWGGGGGRGGLLRLIFGAVLYGVYGEGILV